MKIKTLAVICSLIFTAIATTSCLNSDETTVELSSEASITAFSINSIDTQYTEKTSAGKDTTITVTLTGSDYTFVIDQKSRLIYNVDSLPVGTDVSKVVVNITSDSPYIMIVNQQENAKDSLWTSTDSLNYENPILMKVVAYSGSYGPVYTTKINVHKQVPDSITWSKIESDFVTANVKEQKSVYFNNTIFVACNINNKAMITSTNISDGKSWANATEIPMAGADIKSLMVWGDNLYILASDTLYKSSDGASWQNVESAPQLTTLVANYYESSSVQMLSAINTENKFVQTLDGIVWSVKEDVDANFPTENISYASYKTDHNSSIYRVEVMGNNPTLSNDSTATVWGNLSTENKWVAYTYNNNGKYCPNLENITMIYYNSRLYAFGGKSLNGVASYSPFSNFFVSENNGANWKSISSKITFPKEFATLYSQAAGNYSCAIDNDNFIWIIWSGSNQVWKGRINRLGFN